MSILLELGLAFGVTLNRQGTWDAWIMLSDGGKVAGCSMETKAVAFRWVEDTVTTWKAAA